MGVLDKFSDMFGKEEEQRMEPPNVPRRSGPIRPPLIQWIIDQKKTGKSEQDIVGVLVSRGYTPSQIQDALSEAGVSSGPEPMLSIPRPEPPKILAESVEPYTPTKELAEIENLIDDRLKKVREDIESLQAWKLNVDARLDELKGRLDQVTDILRESREKERTRFEEYDRHLSEVKVELKATQEVFKKGLPEFVQGIQEISRIVRKKKEAKE